MTVFTKSLDGGNVLRALVREPRKTLNLALKRGGEPPNVEISTVKKSGVAMLDEADSGTVVEVRGYDNNNWDAFAHVPIRTTSSGSPRGVPSTLSGVASSRPIVPSNYAASARAHLRTYPTVTRSPPRTTTFDLSEGRTIGDPRTTLFVAGFRTR